MSHLEGVLEMKNVIFIRQGILIAQQNMHEGMKHILMGSFAVGMF